MKKFLPFFILAIFALGACTETIYEEIIKLDTVYLSKPQSFAPTFITVRDTIKIVDTIRVETVITKTDTLIKYVTKDSLIIQTVEKIVYHTDTVTLVDTVVNNIHTTDTVTIIQHDTVTLTEYVQRVVYLEYQFLFPGQSTTFIPLPLQGIVNDFFARCTNCHGGDLVIEYVDDLPGDNWHSNSFRMSGDQWILQLHTSLIVEESRSSIYRELARIQLAKKYTTDQNKIMCPWFRTSPDPTVSEINALFQ